MHRVGSGLSPGQLRNAQLLIAASKRPIIRKAIVEAGLVESGLRHLPGDDRDSTGILQQRPSQGWGGPGESVSTDAAQFVRAAQKVLAGGFSGSAGKLAQAVQRSAFPARYDQQSGTAESLLRGAGSSSAGGGGSSAAPAAGQAPGFDPGAASTSATDLLSSMLGSRQQAAPVSAPAAPSFSAQAVLPQGYQAPVSTGGPAPQPGVEALLDAVRTQGQGLPQQAGAPETSVAGSSSAAGGGARAGAGRSPVAVSGALKLIGQPYAGTHTLGDWQSDRAYDIAVPKGTPMVALQDGEVVKVRKHPQGAGRFAGDQITIRGANGNEYFYAHGVADVKAGQRVKKGQQLGVTGSANGVEHLHFAQRSGDPSMHLRRR